LFYSAPTEVIALENTLNGTIIPQEEVVAIAKFARSKGVKMHLDGARVWHVATETGLTLKEICAPFDSVSMCFSKGLGRLTFIFRAGFQPHSLRGAPVGSCLVGSADMITRARRFRKLFGGGMRQTGILAASAVYALNNHFPLLPRVHALAKKVQGGLENIGATITSPAETCMVSLAIHL
jgi:threonine aldolase